MKPLITKAQGIACRKAAEYIAARKLDASDAADTNGESLLSIGWCHTSNNESWFSWSDARFNKYNQSEVLMALLWCAEIAGEA